MKQTDRSTKQALRLPARLGPAAAAFLCLLLWASSASAAYEQIGTFAGTPGALKLATGTAEERSARWPEEVQLGGLGGMAVNYTGAGGVPKGTLYAATLYSHSGVARFNPDGSFSEAWTFRGSPPEERCGPEGDPAHPVCTSQPEASADIPLDVDVDQSTGYVYVYDGSSNFPGIKRIHVYSPDGSKVIAEFGEEAALGETTAASPAKLHTTVQAERGTIAVNSSGDIYVFDPNNNENYRRLMEFEPQSPGDYEHYVYAGQSHDVMAGFGPATKRAARPVADSAGDVYIATEDGYIAKLDPSQPSALPLCTFNFAKGGIISITVNPQGGEVFFSSEKDKGVVHQLSSTCDEGKFVETSTFSFLPKRAYVTGLAFDPSRELEAGRPAGVLYAGAPSGEGGKTEGKSPDTQSESALGYVFSRPAAVPPTVDSQSVSGVATTTAELAGQINPKGSATRYAFQYETEAQYENNEPGERFSGASEAPLGGAIVGEGTEAVGVSVSLAGLAPDTAYRYRAVATSHCSVEDLGKVCEGTGGDGSFHTFPVEAPGLPDKRVYELVSPVQKQGGQVLPADPFVGSCSNCKPGQNYTHFPMQSSPAGTAIVYEGTAFDSEQSALIENEYIARRDPKAGWQTTNLTPTLQQSQPGQGYKSFDAELARGVLAQQSPVLSPEAPSEYEDLYAQPTANPLAFSPLLTAEPPGRPATGAGNFQLRYAGASADLSRIFFEANDALTAETPFAPEAIDGGSEENNLYEWDEGRLALVNVMPGNAVVTNPWPSVGVGGAKAISKDGSRVFFSDASGQVYLREDAEATKAITTEGTPDPGEFLAAATDGSRVLLANGHLHDLGDEEPTVDLTQGKGGFQGVVGESEDLSHVYFVDTEVLTGEEENGNCEEVAGETICEEAQEGKDNLYAWTEGEGTRFVASLVAIDNGTFGLGGGASDWHAPYERTAEASPRGRYLAFLSTAPITGYDSTGPCESDHAGGYVSAPCAEAFLYDSATGKLVCASCNPSGESPLGASVLPLIGAAEPYLPQPRYLTDEGRLYFDSRDALVPADTNDGVEDAYEYEPDEVGTCEREAGCVSLISAGTGTSDSNFLAIDPSGQNIFFTSRDQLVLRDKDELIDLYDAREEGGIPAETEVARSECQGEACQAPVSAPNDPTPGSSTFEGAGNVEEKKTSKKHKKKRHAKKHGHKRAANHNRGGTR